MSVFSPSFYPGIEESLTRNIGPIWRIQESGRGLSAATRFCRIFFDSICESLNLCIVRLMSFLAMVYSRRVKESFPSQALTMLDSKRKSKP